MCGGINNKGPKVKKWEHGAFEGVISERLGGNLYDWPEVAEALAANGVVLPLGTCMKAVREICRLILAERKTTDRWSATVESNGLQSQLLDRDIYASRHDISECYRDYCNDFACSGWLPLSYWDDAGHIGPVDYIAARVSK